MDETSLMSLSHRKKPKVEWWGLDRGLIKKLVTCGTSCLFEAIFSVGFIVVFYFVVSLKTKSIFDLINAIV